MGFQNYNQMILKKMKNQTVYLQMIKAIPAYLYNKNRQVDRQWTKFKKTTTCSTIVGTNNYYPIVELVWLYIACSWPIINLITSNLERCGICVLLRNFVCNIRWFNKTYWTMSCNSQLSNKNDANCKKNIFYTLWKDNRQAMTTYIVRFINNRSQSMFFN